MISSSNFFRKSFFTSQDQQSLNLNSKSIELGPTKSDILSPWMDQKGLQHSAILNKSRKEKRPKEMESIAERRKEEDPKIAKSTIIAIISNKIIPDKVNQTVQSGNNFNKKINLPMVNRKQQIEEYEKNTEKYQQSPLRLRKPIGLTIDLQSMHQSQDFHLQEKEGSSPNLIRRKNLNSDSPFLLKRRYQRRFVEAYNSIQLSVDKRIKKNHQFYINKPYKYSKISCIQVNSPEQISPHSKHPPIDLYRQLIAPIQFLKKKDLIKINHEILGLSKQKERYQSLRSKYSTITRQSGIDCGSRRIIVR